MADQALSDVKVIDLTHHIAGPYCTKLLADYGAEVIKIENPNGGDIARRLGPFPGDIPHPEKSGTFLHLNTNKKSITLNLETATGLGILKELVKDADILVETYPPKVAQSLGVTYEALEKVNPRLVMTSITPFGQTGPYRDHKLNELTLYAIAATMHGTGVPDREPQKLGLNVITMQCGNVAAAATLGAFYGARYKGIGQHVDVAMMEVQTGTMDRGGGNLISAAWCDSPNFVRAYGTGFNIIPNGVFPCADGYAHCAGGTNPAWWARFCQMIDRPDMIDDPRYAGPNFFNLELREEVEAIFMGWLADKTKVEAMLRGQKEELPVTAINTIDDLFTDPQLTHRQYFVEIDHPAAGKLPYPGPNFRMIKTPARVGRAPLLGEHNEEIYCGRLGYSKEELVRLRERGVV